jgi:hypothetical protein
MVRPVVVGSDRGVAELAAGSPVCEPRPLGAPACAYVVAAGPPAFELPPPLLPALWPGKGQQSAKADATARVVSFMHLIPVRPTEQSGRTAKVPARGQYPASHAPQKLHAGLDPDRLARG